MKKPKVCIITGAPGAGKSTIAKKLAHQSKRGVYIDVDYVRHMVKGGYVSPYPLKKETKLQIGLSRKNTCVITKNFLNQNFDVFIADVLEREEQIKYYKNSLRNYKLFIFLLFPEKRILGKRDRSRGRDALGKRALELHEIFKKISNNKNFIIIDNSNENSKQTYNNIKSIINKVV